MSKYTTEVRFICETMAGYVEQQGYGKVDDILTVAAPKIFDFDFPIFDEDYRLGLEKKILRHFYTREISEETVGLWKLRLDERMNLIMPYYNQLYESELIVFDPMRDVDLTTTSTTGTEGSTEEEKSGNTTNEGIGTSKTVYSGTDGKDTTYSEDGTSNKTRSSTDNQSGTTTDTSHTTDAYSDTPQGTLENVAELEYLTNARMIDVSEEGTSTNTDTFNQTDVGTTGLDGSKKESGTQDYEKTTTDTTSSTGTSDSKKSGTSKSTEEYIQNVAGKRSLSSFSSYLIDFRNTFLNIDKLVIEELNDLFINLW